jgi:hypothetical protein
MQQAKNQGWPKQDKELEHMQKAKIRQLQRNFLKGDDYDKLRKADKKIGGVRGKFHPSIERTRKKT